MLHFLRDHWEILLFYIVLINFITFCTFGADKHRARKEKRRVPEKTLFLLSGLGGSIGAIFAMRVFRHKTLHRSFRYGIPAILLAQVALIITLIIFL